VKGIQGEMLDYKIIDRVHEANVRDVFRGFLEE
jgi:hypothetical protein